ncbi:DNA helicase UvrD, partial [bacterium]|nr:DNA helicase UvrD [bacterium]
MKFIADFHIHSKYSRATSKNMEIEVLSKTAKAKGIDLLGTGDFTHPAWLEHLEESLTPGEGELYKHNNTHFILTAEVSNIYSKNGRGRRIHNILFAPDFATVDKINKDLAAFGNLSADGRPMLGLDCPSLVEIVLGANPACLIVPAHCWTPWYSLFGANSGFDTIEECFEQYTK